MAIGVFLLCINIIFKKNGKFPDGEVGHNKELRKRGIVCMREEDEKIWGKSSYIRITKGRRVKLQPDESCAQCEQICEIKNLINK